MNIKEIEKAFKAVVEKSNSLRSQIESQKAKIEELEAKAQMAAAAGDLDQYKQLKNEIADLDTSIFVLNAQLETVKSHDAEAELKSAWNDYVSGYNKKLKKLTKEYESARHSLYEKYMTLCKFQNDALQLREKCADFLGIKPMIGSYDADLANFPLDTLSTATTSHIGFRGRVVTSPEMAFFIGSGEAGEELLDYFHDVLYLHRSHS